MNKAKRRQPESIRSLPEGELDRVVGARGGDFNTSTLKEVGSVGSTGEDSSLDTVRDLDSGDLDISQD